VDAAADRGDRLRPADGLPDLLDFPAAVVAEVPRRRAAGDVEEEVAQDGDAALGVRDLGMELDAVAAPLRVLERGDRRVLRRRRGAEAGRAGQDAVAMTGPDALPRRRAGEERRLGHDLDLGAAVFA